MLFLALAGCGLLLSCLGVFFWKTEKEQKDREAAVRAVQTQRIVGKVVDLIPAPDEEGFTIYAPKVEYSVNNKRREFTSTGYSNPSRYQIGDKVTICVDPARPDDAHIDEPAPAGMLYSPSVGILLAIAGVVFMIGGIICFFFVSPE